MFHGKKGKMKDRSKGKFRSSFTHHSSGGRMHKVSRTLLLAGFAAFGTLTVACGDKVEVVGPPVVADAVQSVTVSPSNASITAGTSITLASNVTSTGNAVKTVKWSTSSAAIATVDNTGKVTGVAAGTVTITATSDADASKAGAAAIVVTSVNVQQPSIAIASVTQGGASVNLSNVSGQIDIAVNNSGGGQIDVFISSSCATNTISASDTPAATQQTTSAQPGTVVLSVNTAAVTASNAPKFPNGNYCIKARLTSGTTIVVATNTTPLTLNNANVFTAALTFASITGGPTQAVSSLNGLAYNQGTLTVKVTPVVFTSSSPVALISGFFTRSGQAAGGAVGTAVFTNVPVTAGVATFVLTDSIGAATAAAANTNIAQYVSASTGDSLVISSATDAAGNSIAVAAAGFAVKNTTVRIDNDAPALAFVTATPTTFAYTVTAPNGYIGALYSFASGTQNAAAFGAGLTTPASDVEGTASGVGGLSTTYYVGPSLTPAATWAAGSCVITGLTAAAVGTDLANTSAITVDQAKVVVKDALGNQTCFIVPVTTTTGSPVTFGVDKIVPTVVAVGPVPAGAPTGFSDNNGAAANTGYNVAKNFSFVWQDSISGFTNAVVTTPLKGTLTKNFFTAGTSPIGDCVLGTYAATPKTCSAALITTTAFTTPPGNAAPWNVFSLDFTNGSATNGYWQFSGTVSDLAGNVSTNVTRLAAFDNVAPAIGALTQSPTAAVSLGTVTVTGTATDNVDLTSTKGWLSYTTAPAPFAAVAGTSFGPNFDAATVTSASASVALGNVYRGLQSTTAGVINAGGSAPTANVTVTDVGTNVSVASTGTIVGFSPAKGDILVGNTFTAASTVPAPATRQTVTTINANVVGLISDPVFQNQPFALVEIYKLVGGELVLAGSITSPLVTDAAPNRTYTYTVSGVALTAAATNTFYAVGRNTGGDAIISPAFTVVNP